MSNWITIWSQSQTDIFTATPKYRNRTMWMTIPIALSGQKVRLLFSNKEGCTDLNIVQAAIWIAGHVRIPVTFDGADSLCLWKGQEQYSDTLPLDVHAGQMLSLAVAFRGDATSGNCIATHVQCSKNGNYVYSSQIDIQRRNLLDSYWGNLPVIAAVSAVEVLTEEKPEVVVCFGDSLTQQSTWTKPLENNLRINGQRTVVLNAGIGGNRLLLGPPERNLAVFGPAGISRFSHDVLGIAGATGVILAMGTNDIGWIRCDGDYTTAGAEQIYSGLLLLANIAHDHNLKAYATTLTPRNGSLDYCPHQEQERLRLNDMILGSNSFDSIIDFASAVADADDASILAPHCDSGDHLHLSGLGGQQVAASIISILGKQGR